MTNAELIAKIKAEIERLKKDAHLNKWEYSKIGNFDLLNSCSGGEAMACEILSFLDTLEPVTDCHELDESEKPINLDFEQELYNRFGMVKDFTLGMRIAQCFYDLGCRHAAVMYDDIEYERQRAEQAEIDRSAIKDYHAIVAAAELAVGAKMDGTRHADSVMIRRFVAFRMRHDGHTLVEISKAMGVDHSTVSHYVRTMKEELDLPNVFRRDIELFDNFNKILDEQIREQEDRDA